MGEVTARGLRLSFLGPSHPEEDLRVFSRVGGSGIFWAEEWYQWCRLFKDYCYTKLIIFVLFLSFVFLGPHLWHMEVLRPGIELEP